MDTNVQFPFIAYNTLKSRYSIITISKQGHIFYSKDYRTREEAQRVIDKNKKREMTVQIEREQGTETEYYTLEQLQSMSAKYIEEHWDKVQRSLRRLREEKDGDGE